MYYYNIYNVNRMSNSNNKIFNITDEINWPYVVKKEARGIDNADFGEVQEIVLHYILTEKGIINKEKFYLPTELVEEFDGEKLRFNIAEQEANEKFKRDNPPSVEEYSIYKKKQFMIDREEHEKEHKNKDITISMNPDSLPLQEKEENHNVKINLEQQDNNLQNKTSTLKNTFEEKEIIEKTKQEVENKARLEAERNARSITQQIQDKAKMEAERNAQSIIQQAEDKARAEAERRSKEITQQAEDKARAEAERRSKEITQQAEDKARAEAEQRQRIEADSNMVSNKVNTKAIHNNPQEEIKSIGKVNNYIDSNSIFNPFEMGITMWQNYYLFFLNLTKEFLKNTIKLTKFEESITN
jgi:hypothetical protein